MHLVVTRSYPPEIGGMQNLMWGLTNYLSKHDLIKVFADDHNSMINQGLKINEWNYSDQMFVDLALSPHNLSNF